MMLSAVCRAIRVAQVDLVLAGAGLVVAELDRDADRFQHGHGRAAEVLRHTAGNVVEVAALVHGDRECRPDPAAGT